MLRPEEKSKAARQRRGTVLQAEQMIEHFRTLGMAQSVSREDKGIYFGALQKASFRVLLVERDVRSRRVLTHLREP